MSKTRKRRILGMTMAQFLILACLALAAIGTIFGGFILISSSTTPGGVSLLPSPLPASQQPTNPPGQPAAPANLSTIPSVVANTTIPENWKVYSATTIELRVPPEFESVNAEAERLKRVELYRAQGNGFLADRLENAPFDYRFWFNYPQPETVTYPTHIVIKSDVLPTLTLDEYIDQVYGAGMPGFEVLDRQQVPVEKLQARRVLMKANLRDQFIGVADYVITDETNLWIISSSSTLEEFSAWLPDFDRVARSFKLLY